jgi:hypothetical protein
MHRGFGGRDVGVAQGEAIGSSTPSRSSRVPMKQRCCSSHSISRVAANRRTPPFERRR